MSCPRCGHDLGHSASCSEFEALFFEGGSRLHLSRFDSEDYRERRRAREEEAAREIFQAVRNARGLPLYHKALITIGVAAAVVGWPKSEENR